MSTSNINHFDKSSYECLSQVQMRDSKVDIKFTSIIKWLSIRVILILKLRIIKDTENKKSLDPKTKTRFILWNLNFESEC